MSSSDSSKDVVLERLAAEFVERHRNGECPPLSEYIARHPDLAPDIRDLFPALVQIERLKPATDRTGDFQPAALSPTGARLERLGDYRILREVGRGGMGVVYEAEQESLGRRVALKVLPSSALWNPTYLERFRREAKAAARLHHTNIVPVFGVGEVDGVPFYAMQFITGEGLDKVLRDVRRFRHLPAEALSGQQGAASCLLNGRFSAAAAEESTVSVSLGSQLETTSSLSASGPEGEYCRGVARIGVQVAEGLAYAHKQGILHRDVKPSNLLLDAQGTVWITDFGLAKAEGTEELTDTGDIVGTMRFMAPERYEGRSLPQSDVYALGLTLYELLTLRPAFDDANKAKLIEKVLHDRPLSPREIAAHVPRDLETIVLKCLAKEPKERYASAEALADDLKRFLADRPIQARRASAWEQTWRWCRRNPAVAALLGTIAGLLVVVTLASLVTAAAFDRKRRQADEARELAVGEQNKGRLREAQALIGEAHGIRLSRRPGQRFAALAALNAAAAIGRELEQPAGWFDRLRNEAIAALALPDVHITEEWPGFPAGTINADVSADFELYARTTAAGAVSVRRVKGDDEVATLPELGERAWAWFGPGRLLLVGGESSRRCQLWDLSGLKPVLRVEKEAIEQDGGFRPDGKLLVLVGTNRDIHALDPATGRPVPGLSPGRALKGRYPTPHPTAPFVTLSDYHHHTVELRDLRSGRTVAEVDPPWPLGMGIPAWSPDGRTLAVPSGETSQIQLYAFDPDAATLRPGHTIDIPRHGGGLDVAFSPAGDRVAGRIWNGIVHVCDVHTGRTLFTTHALTRTLWDRLRFDPKGARLAAARVGDRQDHIGVWSVADGREHRVLVPRRTGAEVHGRFAVHPGGRLAAMNLTPGGVALFDLETGAEIGVIPIHRVGGNDSLTSLAFDGTGALLTNAWCGLLHWPIRADLANPGRWTVGPPQPLPFHPGQGGIAASGDGKVVAQTMFNGYGEDKHAGGWILHPNSPRPRWVERGAGMYEATFSRDGRVAIFQGRVYDTATGKRLWQAPEKASCRMSPDGRWLVTNAEGGRVFAFGTWEPGVRVGGGHPCDVSPDSTLVVMALPNAIFRLVELATGRELAQLEEPDQTRTEGGNRAVFTPDGTRLVVAAKDSLHVWDLRLLRQRLKEMDLDWDAPSYPEAPRDKPGPLEVQIVGAELTDPQKRAEHQWQSALATLFFNPFDADAHFRLGRHLRERGNAERAHAHLGVALAFRPDLHEALYPRAMAGLRLRRWKEALADFTLHLRHYPEDDEAYHFRGHANEALHRYGDAAADFSAALKNQPKDAHLLASRAEAYLMLGRHADAVADSRKSLESAPEQARPNRVMAWVHANGPAPFRDPEKALPFAERAVALDEKVSGNHHVLGVVHYRLGRWEEAISAFQRGLEARSGQTTAYYDFFLAMCHAKLGAAEKARECFTRAVQWVERQKDLPARSTEELKAFRAEAEEALRPSPKR